MGTLSSDELAAHQIALQSAATSFMIPLGIAIATSVRVGQAIGADDKAGAEVAGYTGMITCSAIMACCAIAFWLLPQSIISLYIDMQDPENFELIKFATAFLAIAALFQIVDGLQVSASNALRGLKDTTAAMILTLIAYLGLGVPTGAILCFVFEMRGQGLWLGLTTGLAAAAILLTSRFVYQIRQTAPSP
jgi:MATE family multidrug resistance protein